MQISRALDGNVVRQFGVFLRKARRDKGLTQKELAKRAAVDQSYVSKLETGDALFFSSFPTLCRVLRGLDVTMAFSAREKKSDARS